MHMSQVSMQHAQKLTHQHLSSSLGETLKGVACCGVVIGFDFLVLVCVFYFRTA